MDRNPADGKMKTVAFFPAHPAQLWVMRPVAQEVSRFAKVLWFLRDKDCTLELAKRLDMEFEVISTAGTGMLGNGMEMLLTLPKLMALTLKRRVDLWFTKYGSGNAAAWLLGRKSLSFNDDDADIVPLIAWTSYPFAGKVLAPAEIRMGRFEKYAVRYAGYHELFYLHPARFTPDPSILGELGLKPGQEYAVVRLSGLQAHHDLGIQGMNDALLRKVLALTPPSIRVFITSEKPLKPEFEPYRMPVPPDRIHHVLAFAQFFVGDSQTMTAEAAVLGTPALRISSFAGRITTLEDMEKFDLTHGFQPDKPDMLLSSLQKILDMEDRKQEYARRRQAMLTQKIDPVPVCADLIRSCL